MLSGCWACVPSAQGYYTCVCVCVCVCGSVSLSEVLLCALCGCYILNSLLEVSVLLVITKIVHIGYKQTHTHRHVYDIIYDIFIPVYI